MLAHHHNGMNHYRKEVAYATMASGPEWTTGIKHWHGPATDYQPGQFEDDGYKALKG
jgi:hypothetical protein